MIHDSYGAATQIESHCSRHAVNNQVLDRCLMRMLQCWLVWRSTLVESCLVDWCCSIFALRKVCGMVAVTISNVCCYCCFVQFSVWFLQMPMLVMQKWPGATKFDCCATPKSAVELTRTVNIITKSWFQWHPPWKGQRRFSFNHEIYRAVVEFTVCGVADVSVED